MSRMTPIVDVSWGEGYDAAAMLRTMVITRTGSDPGPLHHHCPACGSITHGQPGFDIGGGVSIARSATVVVVAYSPDAPIGIDVTVADGAARAWTRREALAKARGTGIVVTHDPAEPDVWIGEVALVPGLTCSLAVLGLSQPPVVTVAPSRPTKR